MSAATREAFLAEGHDVTVVTRGRRALPAHARLRPLVADRGDPHALGGVLAGERFDFTVDFLAYDRADVEGLMRIRLEPGRLVAISSGQVYLVSEASRPPFREEDANAPLMERPQGGRDLDEWIYGVGKRAVEEALRRFADRGVPALALRLPVIQGERDGQGSRRLWAWLERMRDGGPVLLPEDGAQRVRFLYADDAARALLALATAHHWPEERELNLAQPDEPTLREFLGRVATLGGLEPRFVPVTAEALREAGLADTCAPYWGRWCSRPDPARAFERLRMRTRTTDEYLPAVVRAHLEQPPSRSHPGYARRTEELALAARLS